MTPETGVWRLCRAPKEADPLRQPELSYLNMVQVGRGDMTSGWTSPPPVLSTQDLLLTDRPAGYQGPGLRWSVAGES